MVANPVYRLKRNAEAKPMETAGSVSFRKLPKGEADRSGGLPL